MIIPLSQEYMCQCVHVGKLCKMKNLLKVKVNVIIFMYVSHTLLIIIVNLKKKKTHKVDSNPSALLSPLTRKHLCFPGRCSIAHDFRSIQVNPRLSALCTRFHRSQRNFTLRWRRKRQGRYELIPENASFLLRPSAAMPPRRHRGQRRVAVAV